MLRKQDSMLLVIDVQGKLARAVHEADYVLSNQQKLAKGAKLFDLPVVLTEQNPKGLGATASEMQEILGDMPVFEKTAFNACLQPGFLSEIRNAARSQVLVCGIEAHVCVFQTVASLMDHGFEVHVAADSVSSRSAWNRETALQRMRQIGAVITSAEMALFELMEAAEGKKFKEFARIVK
ncbi:MAG: hydrolase [Desulfosalsimonas sp.]